MTHAAVAMVRSLRQRGKLGLLYGQGGFVTKHHGLVLSREAPKAALLQDTSVQAEADRNRRKVPDFVTEAGGKGKVEAFTVIYKGKGEVEHGVVMMRTEGDQRALGRIPAGDTATLAHLLKWTARQWDRSARSRPPKTACWSGGWGSLAQHMDSVGR